jgi:hypothetical protein
MTTMKRTQSWTLMALLALAAPSCSSGPATGGGSCAVDNNPQFNCGSAVGYSCIGSARPEGSRFVSGIPQGLICNDLGMIEGNGTENYCCSAQSTPCAYDPVAACAAPAYGYECRGAGRPESYNETISCGEGLVQGDLVIYCCSDNKPSQGCAQATGGCPSTLVPWTCTDNTLPSEFELGSNQSRADFNLLVCSVPTVTTAASRTTSKYCCFTPTSVPKGASCLQDTTLSGCGPGSFGFACTGPDTPEQDYPRINCGDAGVSTGKSAEGYNATLYCCQFQ